MRLKPITKEQYISLAQMKIPAYACDQNDEDFGNRGVDHLIKSDQDLEEWELYSELYLFFYAIVDG